MFKTLRNALKIEDIRKKLIFTFLMLVVVRFGSQLPIPGANRDYFQAWFAQQTGDAFNFFDAFTGGSFTSMSLFALGITPYITSSIIVQLLTIAIPKLEEMQKDGEDGRKKIQTISLYLTVALALIESIAMTVGFGRSGLIPDLNFLIFPTDTDICFGKVRTSYSQLFCQYYIGNFGHFIMKHITDIGIYQNRIHSCKDAVHYYRIPTVFKIQIPTDIIHNNKILPDSHIQMSDRLMKTKRMKTPLLFIGDQSLHIL